MKQIVTRTFRIAAVLGLCLALASCEEPRVYGSVGFSSYGGGGYYGPRVGGSITIGGRIH